MEKAIYVLPHESALCLQLIVLCCVLKTAWEAAGCVVQDGSACIYKIIKVKTSRIIWSKAFACSLVAVGNSLQFISFSPALEILITNWSVLRGV